MRKKLQITLYLISDFFSAVFAWFIFTNIRTIYLDIPTQNSNLFIELSIRYFTALIGIPVAWILLYYTTGAYRNVFRKSRLKELGQTFMLTLTGSVIIFFFAVGCHHKNVAIALKVHGTNFAT